MGGSSCRYSLLLLSQQSRSVSRDGVLDILPQSQRLCSALPLHHTDVKLVNAVFIVSPHSAASHVTLSSPTSCTQNGSSSPLAE